jgi:menaquinone-9 beta-reductase
MNRNVETDVFVAGGGPAGLAAAIAARQAGFDVILADVVLPPIDKACGEGIMPDGLDALERLGVVVPPDASIPFRGIRFVGDGHSVVADFPGPPGRGIRRRKLHELLRNAAADAGVSMMWGTRVTKSPEMDGLCLRRLTESMTVEHRQVHARWIVAADGHESLFAADAGLRPSGAVRRRLGFREHFPIKPWSEHVEVHWADCGQLYITPVAHDEICVVFITRQANLRFTDALSCFPEAARRISGIPPIGSTIGGVTLTRKLRAVFRGNLALAGDASGSVDAITGEGLAMSFQQATALAAAMREGDLTRYQRAHVAIMRRPRMMGELMLLMDRYPRLRHRVFRVFSSAPDLFARTLAVHMGAASPLDIGLRNVASFGWRLVTR